MSQEKIERWNEVDGNLDNGEKLQAFLDSTTDAYAILQLRRTDETVYERFESYEALKRQGKEPNIDHYDVVYFSDFVFQLSELGYEFKDGKQPAFRHSGEKRFIRLRSLGEGYSQEDIIAILSGKSVQKASRASRQVHTQREFNLLIDIQEKMAEGKSAGYERWAKKYNRKEAARTVCLLKEKGISNYEELTALTEQLSSRFAELSDTIKANEKRMVEIGALQTHINNYSRTRSVYEAYRKSGYSIKFFEEHREEIQIHKAAKKAFDQLPGKKVPTRQSLNEEYHRLLSGKKEAYAEYRQVKKDMQEYLIAKQTVEHILGIDRKNRIITQQQNLD